MTMIMMIPAPTNPGVNRPRSSISTSVAVLILLAVNNFNIFDLATASGTGNDISFEKRPLTLGSIDSVLLVAAISITIFGNVLVPLFVLIIVSVVTSLLVLSQRLLILSILSHNCDIILLLVVVLLLVLVL